MSFSRIPRYEIPVDPPGVPRPERGPDKNELPTATRIGCFSEYLRELVQADIQDVAQRSDLGDRQVYPISYGATVAVDGYRQIILQHMATTGEFERDYTVIPDASRSMRELTRNYPTLNPFRARVMLLAPGSEVPWHVDANTLHYCRIHFLVEGRCQWFFRRKSKTWSFDMAPGEIWFTNTGWPHMIQNTSPKERVMLTLHVDHKDLVETFGDLIEHAHLHTASSL